MVTQQDIESAPFLAESGTLAHAARHLVESSRRLGEQPAAVYLRAWCIAHLIGARERIFESNVEPLGAFAAVLRDTAHLLDRMASTGFSSLGAGNGGLVPVEPVEIATGEHYGRLFRDFSEESYWEEPKRLLDIRLRRNGFDPAQLSGRSVLDAGCGGGRYSAALRLVGACPVTGVDISPLNIQTAQEHARQAGLDGLRFETANVLELPFSQDSFDGVFSNGVLHHTRDWRQGVRELVRVLRPGGWGWLYLIEKPGGLFWDSLELLRLVMQGQNRELARAALRMLGIPSNRVFYMLDHVMVPVNVRLTPEEVESALREAGACEIRRLERGTDFDRIETIYRREPFAHQKVGVGENRYFFTKA